MIDTVKIAINCKFRLSYDNSPFCGLSQNDKGFRESKLSGKMWEIKTGLHYPTVIYVERPKGRCGGITNELCVEFSVPKLLYRNNLMEVDESDFENVVGILRGRLVDMGFDWISTHDIKIAEMRRLDVGKNIILKGRSTTGDIIRSFEKATHPRLKEGKVCHENGGYQIRWSSKSKTSRVSEDITLYDKSMDIQKDLMKKPLKSIGLEGFNSYWNSVSVLRFEVRLRGKKSIVRRMERSFVATPNPLTFESIFKKEVCKKIVQTRFSEIYDSVPKLELDIGAAQMFQNLMAEEAHKRGGYKIALMKLGVYALLQDKSISGEDIDKIARDNFGVYGMRMIRKMRQDSFPKKQLLHLLAVKKAINEFKLIKSGGDYVG